MTIVQERTLKERTVDVLEGIGEYVTENYMDIMKGICIVGTGVVIYGAGWSNGALSVLNGFCKSVGSK